MKKQLEVYDFNVLLSFIRKGGLGKNRVPISSQLKYMEIIFQEMKQLDKIPDLYTYNELISINAMLLNFERVQSILNNLKNYGPYPDIAIYNNVIKIYSHSKGTIDQARSCWDELVRLSKNKNSNIKLDKKSFTAIIAAEVNAQNWDSVKKLLEMMQDLSLEVDIVLRNIILQSITENFDLNSALEESKLIESTGIKLDSVSYYLLLDLAIRENNIDVAKDLLKKSIDNNSPIDSTQISNLNLKPVEIIDFLDSCKYQIDQQLYTNLIYKSLKSNDFLSASLVFNHMKKNNVESNLKIYTLWINSLSKFGQIEKIHKVYNEMISKATQPDIMIFNSIFEAITIAKTNLVNKKKLITFWLKEMKHQKVDKNSFFYNTMFSCYSYLGFDMFGFKYTLGSMIDMKNRNIIELETRSFNLLFKSFNSVANLIDTDPKAILNIVQIISEFELGSGNDRFFESIYESGDNFDLDQRNNQDQVHSDRLHLFASTLMRWYYSMKKEYSVPPDFQTYNLVLMFLVKLSQPLYAIDVYRDMKDSLKSDQSTIYHIFSKNETLLLNLIEMFYSKNSPEFVLEIWRDLIQFGLEIDPLVIAIMLKACDKLGYKETIKNNMASLLPISYSDSSYKSNHTKSDSLNQNQVISGLHQMYIASDSFISSWSKSVDNRVMNLYLVLMIKYNMINEIMPTLEAWKLVNSPLPSLTLDIHNNTISSENENSSFPTNSLSKNYSETYRKTSSFHNGQVSNQITKNSPSINDQAYFLNEQMVEGLFKLLSTKSVVEKSNGDSKKILAQLGKFIEVFYPNSLPI
ncbi:Protein Rf1, mitochondrial [Smittium culicis]|uniref:Protein Rf1, mitochondrial n=1 Tax=Smittium culicis TaxID=133412 RepID=A0A1R1X502_9FUNG|nr:Protein Rf1, mitochondrial [Smittium culicis]